MPTPIPIAVAVVRRGDEFLVGRRAANAALGDYAEFPGGKVERGESPAEAAARECLEEAGIECVVGEAYPQVVHQYDHARLRLFFFACTPCDPAAQPRPPFRWAPREELAKLTFPEANATLLAAIAESQERRAESRTSP